MSNIFAWFWHGFGVILAYIWHGFVIFSKNQISWVWIYIIGHEEFKSDNPKSPNPLNWFKKTLKHVDKFDVLVGYFRISGFYQLYKELEKVNKIRILNGLDVDQKTFEAIDEAKKVKIDYFEKKVLKEDQDKKLNKIQAKLDLEVEKLYGFV